MGDTVQWVWESDFHSVTSGTASLPSGEFDSDIQNVPFTFSRTFLAAGNFDYFCLLHKMMTGVVHVFGTSTVSLLPSKTTRFTKMILPARPVTGRGFISSREKRTSPFCVADWWHLI